MSHCVALLCATGVFCSLCHQRPSQCLCPSVSLVPAPVPVPLRVSVPVPVFATRACPGAAGVLLLPGASSASPSWAPAVLGAAAWLQSCAGGSAGARAASGAGASSHTKAPFMALLAPSAREQRSGYAWHWRCLYLRSRLTQGCPWCAWARCPGKAHGPSTQPS